MPKTEIEQRLEKLEQDNLKLKALVKVCALYWLADIKTKAVLSVDKEYVEIFEQAVLMVINDAT